MQIGSTDSANPTPRFREHKAADVAFRFLERHSGKMSCLKLVKLIYIVERESLLRWGRSVTYDRFVSMPHGPVLSRTLDLITEEAPPNEPSVFNQHISQPSDYKVELRDPFPMENSTLSPAEIDLIDDVYGQYGHLTRWNLVEITHSFPEWEDPQGSSTDISIRSILERNGKTEPEADAILSELNALALAERTFG